jgi:hypothetical protein
LECSCGAGRPSDMGASALGGSGGAPPASRRPWSSRPLLAAGRRVSTGASVLGRRRLDARVDLGAQIASDIVVLAGELAHLVWVRVRVRVRVGVGVGVRVRVRVRVRVGVRVRVSVRGMVVLAG